MTTLFDQYRAKPASYWVTVASVVTVAVVAAIVSYSHVVDIAHAAGESWRSYLIPWAFDGLVAAASMTMMVRRARKLSYGLLPLVALAVGVIGSVAANVSNAVNRPETVFGNHGVAVMLGGFVPLAFLACFHMLLGQHALVSVRTARTEQPGQADRVGITDHDAGLPGTDISIGDPDQVGQLRITGNQGQSLGGIPAPFIPDSSSRGRIPVSAWRPAVGGSDSGTGDGVEDRALGQPVPVGALAGAVSGNGKSQPFYGDLLALLPPLAELQVSEGKSVNGHPDPQPAHSQDCRASEVDDTKAATRSQDPADTARDSSAAADCGDGRRESGSAEGITDDVTRYLDDELYVLAASNGLTLDELLRTGRISGSPPASRSGPAGTARQSSSPEPGPTDQPETGARGKVSAAPTPTTPTPRSPSPTVPAPVPGSVSSDLPPTNQQILTYLDTNPGITVRQAATDLKVSESTVYRAKRTRTASGASSS